MPANARVAAQRKAVPAVARDAARPEGEPHVSAPRVAGVILAGGESRRMGRAKAALSFGSGTLLDWMIELVGSATPEVWISVAAGAGAQDARASRAGEETSTMSVGGVALPRGARGVIPDDGESRGPLPALRTVLARLQQPILFVACDLPFLAPADLLALVQADDGPDAILLRDASGAQPLAARYDPRILPLVERQIAHGRLAMHELIAASRHETRRASERCPGIAPLANINALDDYYEACRLASAAGLLP